jgi:hypothetical protein
MRSAKEMKSIKVYVNYKEMDAQETRMREDMNQTLDAMNKVGRLNINEVKNYILNHIFGVEDKTHGGWFTFPEWDYDAGTRMYNEIARNM